MTRTLVCTVCAGPVTVHEAPREFIAAHRFVCQECLDGDIAIRLDEREEWRRHDPGLADLPEGY